jgi:predicted DCC family thiol-disulfide oxidoreductase YuxK
MEKMEVLTEAKSPVAADVRVEAWFDSDCPLCRREIAMMRRLDRAGRVRFLDLATTTDCPLDPGLMLARFHAREDGRLLDGAAAFAAVWRQIPLLRPLGLAARNRVVLAGLERLYRMFLRVRPSMQAMARRAEGRA